MTNNIGMSGFFNDMLKYRDKYEGSLIVIKFGGALAESDGIIRSIASQTTFLVHNIGARIVVVHGGGRQIDDALKKENITIDEDKSTGFRRTNLDTLRVADRALRDLNGHIVRIFQEASRDIRAVGMAGYDARIVEAGALDMFTGKANAVNVPYLQSLVGMEDQDVIPVIYPICWNEETHEADRRLNVNADNVASAIASQMNARRLILCSDIPGVLDKDGNRLTNLSNTDIDRLIETGVVTGGMIAKVRAAAHAASLLSHGGVVILDGRTDSSILSEIFLEDGIGTLIRSEQRIRALSLDKSS